MIKGLLPGRSQPVAMPSPEHFKGEALPVLLLPALLLCPTIYPFSEFFLLRQNCFPLLTTKNKERQNSFIL